MPLSNHISVLWWRSVLLQEETRVPGENLSQVTDKLYLINVVLSTPHERGSNS